VVIQTGIELTPSMYMKEPPGVWSERIHDFRAASGAAISPGE
jgi:hypothetical protein